METVMSEPLLLYGVARVASETSNANNSPADRLQVGDAPGRHRLTARPPRAPDSKFFYP